MCQINNPEIYDRICTLYSEVLAKAQKLGFTGNIEIHISPVVAGTLGLKDKLTIVFPGFEKDVPIVVDDMIRDKKLDNQDTW